MLSILLRCYSYPRDAAGGLARRFFDKQRVSKVLLGFSKGGYVDLAQGGPEKSSRQSFMRFTVPYGGWVYLHTFGRGGRFVIH